MTLENLIKDADKLATDAAALAHGLRGLLPVAPPDPVVGYNLAAARYLEGKKLTLPVNEAGELKGRAREIMPDALMSFSGPYFSIDGQVITFACPPKGATTATAKYPRTELKYLKEFSVKEPWSDTIYLSIDQLAEGQKVVIHQIHDANEPWVKIVADAKGAFIRLRALIKQTDGAPDTEQLLSAGQIRLGEILGSNLDWNPAKKQLTCAITGVGKSVTMNRLGKGGKAYGKAGAYVQGGTYGVKLRHYV